MAAYSLVHPEEEDDGYLSDEEGEDEEEGDDDSEVLGSAPKENAVYNVDGLHEKLEDISWTDGASWLDTLVMPSNAEVATEGVDVNDDLAREMAFYSQALEGAKAAYVKFQELGIPFIRPTDYYAEMVKSDQHMLRVKDRLLAEQRQLAETEERRKQRDSKRYSKEVQAEKLKERAKQKKHDIESVKKWRKTRQSSDFTEGGDDFPIALGDEGGAQGSGGRGRGGGRGGGTGGGRGGGTGGGRGGRASPGQVDRSLPRGGGQGALGPSKKRQSRDTKFGFGGRKRLNKQNTADSAGDMSGFKAGRNGDGFMGGGKGPKGGSGQRGKKMRPGKARRQQTRGK